jgi:preprotein translocase subunit SecD
MRRQVIMLVTTVVVVVVAFVATVLGNDRPLLGLDLQGGISIVLFPVKGSDTSTLDVALTRIRDRVDGAGIAEPEVNRQGNTIVVDLPGVKNREEALRLVGETGELRYREVVNFLPWDGVEATTSTTTKKSGATTTTKPGATTTTNAKKTTTTTAKKTTTTTGKSAGRTINAEPIAAVRPAQQTPTSAAPATTAAPKTTTATTVPANVADLKCTKLITPSDQEVAANAQVWLPDPDRTGCYQLGPTVLTGKDIGRADARYDPNQGWLVDISFKNDDFVTKVAQPFVNKSVAIDLDGVVQSAPRINPGIEGRDVQITGQFSESEAKHLAQVLKYGALPLQFDKEQQTVQSVSPTLGKDQLRAGIIAGIIGLALVALYMIIFYRLLGIVVWLGLLLTGMIFFVLVSYLSAHHGLTLTLAGVTGLIVSVGVTVDSYVVYFERLKDEVRTGKTIRSSLDGGFHKAFRTIIAADLVSLLGAVVLYLLASGSVRGFAFFLGMSTFIDLVLAYLFMHPLVVVLARRPGLVRAPKVGIAAGLDVAGVKA